MNYYQTSIPVACTFFLLTLLMFYLKKLLFFEDQDKKTQEIMSRLIIIQIPLLLLTVLSSRISYIYFFMLYVNIFYIYGSIVYCSFRSRTKRKWFAFIIPLPLVFISLSLYNICHFPLLLFAKSLANNNAMNYIRVLVLVFFTLLVVLLRNIKNSPIQKLEHYGEGKSLSFAEEASVCAAAVILAVNVYFASNIADNPTLRYLLMGYGFILATIILFTMYYANGRQYFESQNHTLQRTLITTMADLVENRDENTGGHIKRTARYVEVIAKELKQEKKFTDILTDEYIRDMIIAAPLHDLGKIHVPDSILDKPGKLTPEEFEIMKTHTTAGYDILTEVEKQTPGISYVQIAKQMAKSHHEWINGNGYPEGLTGDDIPLCAKIMAIADVFDALVSKRCYKPAMPLDKACAILKEETGTHFDEDVSAAFFAAYDLILEAKEEEDSNT